MSENLKDAIISISKGKSTRLKIGSKAIPHRLRQDERCLVSRALKSGFIELHPWNRINASNIYEKMCLSLSIRPVFCLHRKTESTVWYKLIDDKESLPECLNDKEQKFLLKENIVEIELSDRKHAKLLAKEIFISLNS